MAPMTMRFTASQAHGVKIRHSHDEVRQGIWHIVAKEMHKHGWKGSLPAITIEQAPLDDPERPVRIDVKFRNEDVMCHIIKCMYEIRIEKSSGTSCCLPMLCFSNSLPGCVLPFDLLRLPLTKKNSELVLKSLNTMLEPLGTVVGLGRYEVAQSVLGMCVDSTTTRAYLHLSPSSITMPFETLIKQMPTHFRWHGTPYALLYAGIELHDTVVQSAEFPIEEEEDSQGSEEEEEDSSGDSSSRNNQGSRRVGRNEQSRKRRRGEEE